MVDGSSQEVLTTQGLARLTWREPSGKPTGVMLLGHSAGGGIEAADLQLVAGLALDAGLSVGLVEQPYRLAGRRLPPPATQLDAAFLEIVRAARASAGTTDLPLIVGGRSSGARVACRTARAVGAAGVLALAFPLQPPQRQRAAASPRAVPPSRLPELLGAAAPTLVVQGECDAFGTCDNLTKAVSANRGADIVVSCAPGTDHSLRRGINANDIATWLAQFLR